MVSVTALPHGRPLIRADLERAPDTIATSSSTGRWS
jgi:hypothetical protein